MCFELVGGLEVVRSQARRIERVDQREVTFTVLAGRDQSLGHLTGEAALAPPSPPAPPPFAII